MEKKNICLTPSGPSTVIVSIWEIFNQLKRMSFVVKFHFIFYFMYCLVSTCF